MQSWTCAHNIYSCIILSAICVPPTCGGGHTVCRCIHCPVGSVLLFWLCVSGRRNGLSLVSRMHCVCTSGFLVCVHVCMCVCMCPHVYMCTCVHVSTCLHVYMCACVHMCTCVHVYVHVCVYVSTCVRVCMCPHVYTYACVCA